MSDSTKDRRQHVRRGSLLDHLGDAEPSWSRLRAAAPGTVDGRDNGQLHGTPAAAPSLLAPPVRTARVSTARYARDNNARATSSRVDAAAPPEQPQPVRPEQEKFGDRISRLIGAIPSRDSKANPRVAPEQPAAPRNPRPEQSASPRNIDASEPAMAHQVPPQREPRDHGYAPSPETPQRQGQRHDDHYHWHAASNADGSDNGSRPLLDASILISAVVRYRYLIGAAAIAGAVLGVAVALSTPHKYYAESRLFVDPREIRVTEDDIRNQQLSTEAMLAITDSQLQILSSTSVLEKVAADLGLERDPEFNGSLRAGGISGGLTLIKEIFTGRGGPSDAEQKVLEKLRDSLSVSRDAKTFVIIIGISSGDPEKSALIANQIVETYLDSEGQAQSNLLERTSESIDTRINALRSDLDAAEREVEKFKAENGLVGVAGQYIDDKVILALSDQLANARAMKVGIRVKANNLAKVNINDVLSGAFPEELLSSNLTELRKQYTETKSTADSLATGLGPRHPQYIAAKSALDTITNEISAELRRIVASSQTELQRAVETEQELASQMAVAKSRAIDQSVELVTLRELERKATATRGIYEAFLTRSRETSERSNFTTRNVRVISPAEAPLNPMGPSRKLMVVGGLFGGLFAGIGLALLAGAAESIRAYNAGPVQARFQTPPFGGYPGAPDPDPRSPSGGPSRRSWAGRDEDAAEGFDQDFDRAADRATARAFAPPHEPATAQDAGLPSAPSRSAPESRPVPEQGGYQYANQDPATANGYGANSGLQPWNETAGARIEQPHPARAFNPAHQQPGLSPQPMPDCYPPTSYPAASQPDGNKVRIGQPLWSAYPARSHVQPQPSLSYPPQPVPAADPYAAFHHAPHSGYAAPQAADGMTQPQNCLTQQGAAPPQQPQFYAAGHFAAQQPAMAAPVWPQPASAPVSAPAPAAEPAMHYPAPQQPTAPFHPSAPVHDWGQPAPSAQPVRHDAVDRIRRDMDVLRSRIDGYGTSRRRG